MSNFQQLNCISNLNKSLRDLNYDLHELKDYILFTQLTKQDAEIQHIRCEILSELSILKADWENLRNLGNNR